jgi:hypothetical protein
MGSASGRGRRWGGQMGDRIDGIDRSDGGRWEVGAASAGRGSFCK